MAAPPPPAAPSPLHTLLSLLHELPGLVSDRVELLALELQRAARALAEIVAWLVVLVILGVTVWLALWAAAVVAALHAGLSWPGALLLAVVFNLAVMAWGVRRMRQLLPQLRLPATRRHLTVSPDPRPRPDPVESPREPHPAATAARPVPDRPGP